MMSETVLRCKPEIRAKSARERGGACESDSAQSRD